MEPSGLASAVRSPIAPPLNPRRNDVSLVKGYVLLGILGVGTFGKVRLGIHCETGLRVAVKIIHKAQSMKMGSLSKLGREIRAMSGLRHPNVIYVHELIDTPTTVFIVMEYVEGGELFDYISQRSRLSEKEAIRMMRQVLSAVDFCHNKMICHRDIKPENILLDSNMNIKLGDFGLSNFMREGECLRTPCGSPNYASPEVICGKSYSGPEIDIWSCGIIFYVLLCGCLPFDDDEMSILFMKIKLGKFRTPSHLSADARWLLRRMLDVNPASRITMRELLCHHWFAGCNYDDQNPATQAYLAGFSSRDRTFPLPVSHAACGGGHPGFDTSGGDDAGAADGVAPNCARITPRWTIGVTGFPSESHCIHLVTDTMKQLGYKWRFLPGFKLFCRRDPEPGKAAPPIFSMQLYKIRHKCYMLDVQIRTGSLLPSLKDGIRLIETLNRNLRLSSL